MGQKANRLGNRSKDSPNQQAGGRNYGDKTAEDDKICQPNG